MKASDYVNDSDYVKREAIEKAGEVAYQIHDVDVAEFGDPKKGTTERRLQLILQDGARFTLNSTNTRVLMKHFGDDTADWAGRGVTLWFDESVSYAGRMVGGIRVRVPKPGGTARPAAPVVQPAAPPAALVRERVPGEDDGDPGPQDDYAHA